MFKDEAPVPPSATARSVIPVILPPPIFIVVNLPSEPLNTLPVTVPLALTALAVTLVKTILSTI